MLLALGLKVVSRAPVEVNLAMLFLVTPQIVVNVPPIIIFPSGCKIIVFIVPFALGLKVVSRAPVEDTLAIRLRVTHPTVMNVPPIRIFPSGCARMLFTTAVVLILGLKVVSRAPVEVNLAA